MKKINILMFFGNTGRGGAQSFAMNVLRTIDREKFQIDFAVNEIYENGFTEEMRELGSEIHIIPRYEVYNHNKYKKRIYEILKTKKYDIVHGNVSSSAVIYLKCARKSGCTTIAHSHSAGYRGNKFETFVKRIFTIGAKKYADYWFACSDKAAMRLFGKEYKTSSRYYYIPNAIRTSDFSFDADVKKRIRKELNVGQNELLFGHIGSLSIPKNHGFLLMVFKEILKIHPTAKLILVGSGPLQENVENEIRELELGESVYMIGDVPNANEYMMAIDAMIFPSLFEGFPMSVIEAESIGTPVILSDTITKEVYLTDIVYPCSLSASFKEWAELVCSKCEDDIDRDKCNRAVSETIYNADNSTKMLAKLYEKMVNDEVRHA